MQCINCKNEYIMPFIAFTVLKLFMNKYTCILSRIMFTPMQRTCSGHVSASINSCLLWSTSRIDYWKTMGSKRCFRYQLARTSTCNSTGKRRSLSWYARSRASSTLSWKNKNFLKLSRSASCLFNKIQIDYLKNKKRSSVHVCLSKIKKRMHNIFWKEKETHILNFKTADLCWAHYFS